MKMFLPIGAVIAFALGMLLGAQIHRYEYVKTASDFYPARFDRWRGTVEFITYKVSEEVSISLRPKPTPSWKPISSRHDPFAAYVILGACFPTW